MSLPHIPRLGDQCGQDSGDTIRGIRVNECGEIVPFSQDGSNLSMDKTGRHHEGKSGQKLGGRRCCILAYSTWFAQTAF